MHPGMVLDGRFVLERIVGEGGMGIVWRALDAGAGGAVAVKVLHRVDGDERFAREVELLLTLRHPGACLQARAAICASAQGREPDFTDRLYDSGVADREALVALAASLGLDRAAFALCL